MPIYEYQCGKCGTVEVTQRITEKSLSRCPTCKSKVKKLISSTSFQLKGTGWYVTDYARKDQAATASKSAKASTSAAESKGESKAPAKESDAKPAAAAEKSAAKTTSDSAPASN